MKILLLTQYFPPEVGAPQNRLFELAVRLQRKGVDMEVLTAMPNYPEMKVMEGYRGNFYRQEEMEGIKVHRGYIYVSTSRAIFSRLLNYFSFVFSSFFIGIFKTNKPDFILCESPPLFLGLTALSLAKIKGSKMIFNVSDLWPESAEKLGLVSNKRILHLTKKLEEMLYRQSEMVTGQTQGIVSNISARFPRKKVYWLPNGVDTAFFNPEKIKTQWRETHHFSPNDFLLFYGGILGHAQGLEVILHAARKLKGNKELQFIFFGDGPEKKNLVQLKEELSLPNVRFFDPVPKKEMPEVVMAMDAAIIPLKKLDLFKGAIPSKIFENLALSKPILLGVEGEAKDLFIQEGKAGLAYEPENSIDLAEKILEIKAQPEVLRELGQNGRRYIQKNFNRDKIAVEFHEVLMALNR